MNPEGKSTLNGENARADGDEYACCAPATGDSDPAQLLNPKASLFFLAYLPQFVHPERASAFGQFVVLGLVCVAMSAVHTILLVFAIGPLGRLLRRFSWLAKWQGKIIGSIFIGLGVEVALQKQ